jgi:hypothetical protein
VSQGVGKKPTPQPMVYISGNRGPMGWGEGYFRCGKGAGQKALVSGGQERKGGGLWNCGC